MVAQLWILNNLAKCAAMSAAAAALLETLDSADRQSGQENDMFAFNIPPCHLTKGYCLKGLQ